MDSSPTYTQSGNISDCPYEGNINSESFRNKIKKIDKEIGPTPLTERPRPKEYIPSTKEHVSEEVLEVQPLSFKEKIENCKTIEDFNKLFGETRESLKKPQEDYKDVYEELEELLTLDQTVIIKQADFNEMFAQQVQQAKVSVNTNNLTEPEDRKIVNLWKNKINDISREIYADKLSTLLIEANVKVDALEKIIINYKENKEKEQSIPFLENYLESSKDAIEAVESLRYAKDNVGTDDVKVARKTLKEKLVDVTELENWLDVIRERKRLLAEKEKLKGQSDTRDEGWDSVQSDASLDKDVGRP